MARFLFWIAVSLPLAFLFVLVAVAQDDGFRVYATLQAGKYTYEIRQHESGIRRTSDTPPPIVFRMRCGGNWDDFALPYHQDAEMFSLHQSGERSATILIASRYEVLLFHPDSPRLSRPIRPGNSVEYGDDAISGTLDGLYYTNGFLTGSAVGYGLFCVEVADWERPSALLRISSNSQNNGQPYLFLKQKGDGLWDGFAAASDTGSLSPHLNRHYTRTLPLRTVFTDMRVDPSVIQDPLHHPMHTLTVHDTAGQMRKLDIRTLEWE